ncbi:MAG: hypothetical protein LUF89_06880 [Ruminococcus sp.]|nr:hypothetical protein [Ruminococcus sp.]
MVHRKAACLWSLALLFGTATGCGSVEVRERTYLQAVEVDATQSDAVSLQLHDFFSSDPIAICTGDSLSAVLSQSAVQTGKSLFFGHLELLAYSCIDRQQNLSQWMEDFRLSPSCQVLGLAQGVSLEQTNTTLLVEQLQYAQESGVISTTNLFSILKELSGSSGMALIPVYENDSISMAIVTEESFCGFLSTDAVKGLCFLRGDAYPTFVELPQGDSYKINVAHTEMDAVETNDGITVTITVTLDGVGNFDIVAATIQAQCNAAIEETITAFSADVFGLEACFQSQCYGYFENVQWEQAVSSAVFEIVVKEK